MTFEELTKAHFLNFLKVFNVVDVFLKRLIPQTGTVVLSVRGDLIAFLAIHNSEMDD